MKVVKYLALACGLTLCFAFAGAEKAEAGYYSSWRYYPRYSYHYTYYRYAPNRYHYCIYYPSRPRYYYYYNPYKRHYWGRFDREGKEGEQYSLLKEEHRKESIKDIKEEHFPSAGAMPEDPSGEGALTVPPGAPKTDESN